MKVEDHLYFLIKQILFDIWTSTWMWPSYLCFEANVLQVTLHGYYLESKSLASGWRCSPHCRCPTRQVGWECLTLMPSGRTQGPAYWTSCPRTAPVLVPWWPMFVDHSRRSRPWGGKVWKALAWWVGDHCLAQMWPKPSVGSGLPSVGLSFLVCKRSKCLCLPRWLYWHIKCI
jgi:hypothetical protein